MLQNCNIQWFLVDTFNNPFAFLCSDFQLFLKSRLTGVQITKDFLAQLVNNSDDLQSSWHNIDMSVLPGAPVPTNAERELIGGPSPKKFRKSKVTS